MGRQDGKVQKCNSVQSAMASFLAKGHRHVISQKIRGQANLSPADAERPSVHLRWALQQMKLRGWTNEAWGVLFESYDNGGQLGTGPVCILESVRAPFDAPATLRFESIEQKYIRWAFKQLADEGTFPEVPVYVSEWNDAQETFEPVEQVLLRAIHLAETDEQQSVAEDVLFPSGQAELMVMFGLTKEMLEEANENLKDEAEDETENETPGEVKDFFKDVLGINLP